MKYVFKWIFKIIFFIVSCPIIYLFLGLYYISHLIWFFKVPRKNPFIFEITYYKGCDDLNERTLRGTAKYTRYYYNNYFTYYFNLKSSNIVSYTKTNCYFGYSD